MKNRTKRKTGRVLLLLFLCAALALAGGYGYLRGRYPLKYWEQVLKSAAEFDLEPELVLAVIWAESSFRPNITSHAGACGLMQIMPETGEWLAGKLELPHFEQEMLFDPEINIRMGCWYLAYLGRRFEGDPVKVLAGYNAGPKNVEKWQEEWPAGYAPGAQDIPFPETRNYVRRVSRAMEIYERMYDLEI